MTTEEKDDVVRRSAKRNKDGDVVFSNKESQVPRQEPWMVERDGRQNSFREILLKGQEREEEVNLAFEVEDPNAPAETEDLEGGIKCDIEEDGVANFTCTRRARCRMQSAWKQALIVKLLGKKIGVAFMKKKLETFWVKHGPITVSDIGDDFYAVQFTSKDDFLHALTGGPWIILGHYLSIRRWEPAFSPVNASISKIAAWVRLPDLPVEFYDAHFLKKVGDWIGRTIKVDRTTEEHTRGRFARICVELDLDQPLKPEYKLEGKLMRIEYEGLFLICFSCGKYGHNLDKCSLRKENEDTKNDHPDISSNAVKEREVQAVVETDQSMTPQDEDVVQSNPAGLGPWMVVDHRRGQRKRNGQEIQKQSSGTLLPLKSGTFSFNAKKTDTKAVINHKNNGPVTVMIGAESETYVNNASRARKNKEKNTVMRLEQACVPLTNLNQSKKETAHRETRRKEKVQLVEKGNRFILLGDKEVQGGQNVDKKKGSQVNLNNTNIINTTKTLERSRVQLMNVQLKEGTSNNVEMLEMEVDNPQKLIPDMHNANDQLEVDLHGVEKPKTPDPMYDIQEVEETQGMLVDEGQFSNKGTKDGDPGIQKTWNVTTGF